MTTPTRISAAVIVASIALANAVARERGWPVTDSFIVPEHGRLSRDVSRLPQFVTVRGGAYFFLPNLNAIRYFAGT